MSGEKEKCPKIKADGSTCGKEPISYRYKVGEKNWICPNGHNFTTEESQTKQAADMAEGQRIVSTGWIDVSSSRMR